MDISQHLASYGIKQFDSDEYWEWGAQRLGRKLAEKLNRLREPISEGMATPQQWAAFYDFIAKPEVAGVVHSSKTGAIRSTGEFIASQIVGRQRVLDVGCSIGYLTTWYGLADPSRAVVGVDVSRKSIEEANRRAKMRGVKNATFECADIATWTTAQTFDAVVDGQALAGLVNVENSLKNVRRLLVPDGVLVSVSALGTADDVRGYIALLESTGFGPRSLEYQFFSDLGERRAYPAIVAVPNHASVDLDIEVMHRRALNSLGIA